MFSIRSTKPLNHQNIKNHSERISTIKAFISNNDWTEISFLSHVKDRKKYELNKSQFILMFCSLKMITKK